MCRHLYVFVFFGIFLLSCTKEEPTPIDKPIVETDDFYPLSVGNQWTYHYFKNSIEARTALVNTGIVVEVEITSEVEIEGTTYFEFQTTTSGNDNVCGFCEENGVKVMKLRDSLGYLVNHDGEIQFSSKSTKEYVVSKNEWGDVYRALKGNQVQVEVPAGAFFAFDNERYTLNPNGVPYIGRDHLYFAKGVGEVKRTIVGTVTNNLLFEKHLISVHLN